MKFRKIDPRIWGDAKFRSLDDGSKLVFFFLLTHPHLTSIGAMRASLPGLAAEIGWEAKAFGKAFGKASEKGMVKGDFDASLVVLPNFLRYNVPESPNVIRGWEGSLQYLPECPLLFEHFRTVKAFAEGMGEAFERALPEAIVKGSRKAMPNPEQEQEQEPEQEQEQEKNTLVSFRKRIAKENFATLWEVYPRKVGKEAAWKAWERITGGMSEGSIRELASNIMTAMSWQSKSEAWVKDGGKFVPHFSTYLNGRRWEDEAPREATAEDAIAAAGQYAEFLEGAK